MREKVLRYICERHLLRPGDRVAAAVSGGSDSVAMLRVLLELRHELGVVLAVAHFNHGLRGEMSQADEAFVADLARQHALEFFAGRADVGGHARTAQLSLEAAGRKLRYEWLTRLAGEQKMNVVATGHTLDDQAETVLLKFLRGTGTRGTAGIYPDLRAEDNLRFVRPLLPVTRTEVETYLAALGQSWREDESNLERRFARNRLRHELLPLLEREYNPNLRHVLAEAAEIARAEEGYWQGLVRREFEHFVEGPNRFSLRDFPDLPLALQRRLLRQFVTNAGLTLDFDHTENLVGCALGSQTRIELPGGWLAHRSGESLELCPPSVQVPCGDYAYVLSVPGEVYVSQIAAIIRVALVKPEFAAEAEPGRLLSADLLGPKLVVRNWQPGDRFWPAHRGSEEKLKRLFAEEHIAAEKRPAWPVLVRGDDVVWVRGFPAAKAFAWSGQGKAVSIEFAPS